MTARTNYLFIYNIFVCLFKSDIFSWATFEWRQVHHSLSPLGGGMGGGVWSIFCPVCVLYCCIKSQACTRQVERCHGCFVISASLSEARLLAFYSHRVKMEETWLGAKLLIMQKGFSLSRTFRGGGGGTSWVLRMHYYQVCVYSLFFFFAKDTLWCNMLFFFFSSSVTWR